MDGIERDVVGGGVFGDSRGTVVVEGCADVVVGRGVENVGDADVVVEPAETVVVVVPGGAGFVVVGAVAVMVDGSVVTVLGPGVTVSVGVRETDAVDVEVVVTLPGSCAVDVLSSEMLAVAEKLALTEITVEFSGAVPVGATVCVSVELSAPVGAGSVVGVSLPMSPGATASLGRSSAALGGGAAAALPATVESDGVTVESDSPTAGAHEKVVASFARSGAPESARTASVVPIAVATNAAATPARVSCRRKRSAADVAAGR
ncbi:MULTISPECIES: hypothetical protein [unclassified Nocardia]|uniref:hypothetical protein n=1 Tax=unclassified Nocardia TaxID=2637762 RepID=UPI00339FE9F9